MAGASTEGVASPAPARQVARLQRRQRPAGLVTRLRRFLAARLYQVANRAEELGWKLDRD